MNKFFKFALVVILLSAVAVADAAVIKVKVAAANVRQQPNATAPIITTAFQGTSFESSKKVGNWYEITVKNAAGKTLTGYIMADLVELTGAGAAVAQVPATTPVAAQPTTSTPAVAATAPRASSSKLSGHFLVMFGPVLSNLSLSEDLGSTSKSYRFGFAGGAGFELQYGKSLAVRISLLFSTGGANFTDGPDKWSYIANALAIPIQLKYNFGGPYVAAGTYFAFLLSPKITWENPGGSGEDALDTQFLNTFLLGLLFGGGYELRIGRMKLFAELDYNLGLTNINKEGPGSVKANSFNLLFGLKI